MGEATYAPVANGNRAFSGKSDATVRDGNIGRFVFMLIQSTTERLPIADNSIDLIFTDPPYDLASLPLYGWLSKEAARILKPNGFCLVMCGGLALNRIIKMLDEHLTFHWKYEVFWSDFSGAVIWSHGVLSRSKPILAYSKGKSMPSEPNVLGAMYGGGNDKRFHHWGQDVESARYYIETHSRPNDCVLDPFIGGGTTAVACEIIGRRWIGCDVDPNALATTALRVAGAEIPRQMNMHEQLTLA